MNRLVLIPLLSAFASLGISTHSVAAQQTGPEIFENYGCTVCHADKRRAFLLGIHSERGIRCHDCHGGNPESFESSTAHSGDFLGALSKQQTVTICSSCHSDPDRMRQYGLPVGQLAEFRTSRHGQLLLRQNNTDAPTCTDCHDAHTIFRPNDARSSVYPTNIPATCAKCHADAELMSRHGLSTEPVQRHRESSHGEALFIDRNFAAPTCVDCHGSHAALPPAVVEIANVCAKCHVSVGRAFYDGPHGRAALAGELPGCTACHSNHGTEAVAAGRIAETCNRCHEEQGPAASLGLEIQRNVSASTEELRSAREAIDEMVRAGRPVADARFRYKDALTSYEQLAQAQHSLDLETVGDLSLRVASTARQIRSTAETAAEQRWEHKLYLIPIWFLALAATLLGWFRLRNLGRDYR